MKGYVYDDINLIDTIAYLTGEQGIAGPKGATGATGKIELPICTSLIAGESLTKGEVCYLHTDGKMYKAQANTLETVKGMLALAKNNMAIDETGEFILTGEFKTTGLSTGLTYYLSPLTPGAFTENIPVNDNEFVRIIGFAISPTILFFNPLSDYLELENE